MNIRENGKKIESIYFLDAPGGMHKILACSDEVDLIFSATYHGDHDEFWVKELRNGKEVARYNCKNLAWIGWAD